MVDLDTVAHNPILEDMVEVISISTENLDKPFFRVVVAYFLSVMAASMQAKLITKDRGELPINCYALATSSSGTGKGHSVNIIEEQFMTGFRTNFVNHALEVQATQSIAKEAIRRAARKGTDENHEILCLEKEYQDQGIYPFVFDDATEPAIKQVRHKLLLAKAGSINFQVDEFGSNIMRATEAMNLYLELYDKGMVKPKLTKNTSDSKRYEPIYGMTPANFLAFGTPAKLFDGALNEKQFFSFLETGYARRLLFGFGKPLPASLEKTAKEIYESLINPVTKSVVDQWAAHFAQLADPARFGWGIEVPDDIAIELIEYRIHCQARGREMSTYEEIRKAEMDHRYFKCLKLAGAFAFVDEAITMTQAHLHAAMKLVEESGEAFESMMNQEKAHEKLARYIAEKGTELTHSDLAENLPFYKGRGAERNDLMTMATAWGYKRHIILKRTFVDDIELFSGETLKETSLSEMCLSYSDHFAYNYEGVHVPFNQLHKLTQEKGFHWANHHFHDKHRAKANVIPGFNMVVLDIDGEASLQAIHDIMAEYTFMTYTTKRHTPDVNRFRLILPMNYELKLDTEDYLEFMRGLALWLPFPTDESTFQCERKWESFDGGKYHYNMSDETVLLDALPFVPKTKKNENYKADAKKLESLSNLERWFAQRISTGSRNNHMIKFALALVDAGMSYDDIEAKVISFNKKLSNGLSNDELRKTVLVTVAKRLQSVP